MGVPDTPENRAKFIATIPLGRMSKPLDVANACLYFASDDAEFITRRVHGGGWRAVRVEFLNRTKTRNAETQRSAENARENRVEWKA